MRITGKIPILGGCILWAAGALLAADTIDPDQYLRHVKYLASPELKGRGTGTPGLENASKYIVKQFKQAGLRPVDGKSYLQPFWVTVNAEMGGKNKLSWGQNGSTRTLKVRDEFAPFNFSSSGSLGGGVVFAGYGITANEYHYDDYTHLDVKGKIVLLLRHEPQENDDKSPFSGKSLTMHAGLESKAANAKVHGAAAVILVNDLPNHPGDADTLDKFARTVGPNSPGIPFVQVKAEVVDAWLKESGKSLKELVAAIDKDLRPQSFALPETMSVKLETDVQRQNKTVHNIVGMLPGETDEYVIIGAHYDHLGMGEQHSLAPASMGKQPHPGADDNASGTAGVLELARWFSKQPKPKRGIVFMTFAAEELGLLGSNFYVNHPELPLNKAVAMINMDMIGRIRDGKVYVGGSGTGTTLKGVLDDVKPRYKLNLDLSEQAGYGSSDHASFTPKDVPVLFFFSGLHGDYHRPSDTWDKIESKEAVELLALVADVATRLADDSGRPQYVKLAPPRMAGGGSGGSGYGPWFGSMPDFAEVPDGFRFADVMPNSPALKAGLKPGDVLFEFGGTPIGNLYDFTAALRAKKPGDAVVVKVRRGTEVVEAKVTLEARK